MEGVAPAMATMRAVATTTGRRTGMKTAEAVRDYAVVSGRPETAKMRAPSQAARPEPKR
jgi:hypothetical protein